MWEVHGQEKLKLGVRERRGTVSRSEDPPQDRSTNDGGFVPTRTEHTAHTRPRVERLNSSSIRRDANRAELRKALKEEDLTDLLDTVMGLGIRKARQLADLDWEDCQLAGVSKLHFKVLKR